MKRTVYGFLTVFALANALILTSCSSNNYGGGSATDSSGYSAPSPMGSADATDSMRENYRNWIVH